MDEVAQSNPTPTSLDVDASLVQELRSLSMGKGFDASMPMGWRWIPFLLGLGMMLAGAGLSATSSSDETLTQGLIAMILGGILFAVGPSTHIARTLTRVRELARPGAVQWAKDRGGTEVLNFWKNAKVHIPKRDDRAWVLPAPTPEAWHLDDRYREDATGLLPEHPSEIGTPIPASFSLFGIGSIVAAGAMVVLTSVLSTASEEPLIAYGVLGASVLILALAWFTYGRTQASMDMPTSKIRSMAIGSNELVGQVRPKDAWPEQVLVDGDPGKAVDGLMLWRWVYEIELEYEVKSKDSEGNETWKKQRSWQEVRSAKGGTPFIIHDGSGGAVVDADSFNNKIVLGDPLIVWSCGHSILYEAMPNAVRSIHHLRGAAGTVASMFDNRRKERILNHRWTLEGLSTGDPIYVMGTVASRPREEIEAEGIDATLQNALLKVTGEKAPGFKPRLERGTELSALGGARGMVDTVIGPVILLLGSLAVALSHLA